MFICWLVVVRYHIGVGALLLFLLQVRWVGWAWGEGLFLREYRGSGCMIYSVGVIAVQYAVIMLASLIISWVGVATEYTFCWGIAWFCTIAGFMLPAAFNAGIWLS